jgi:PBP1b-binding outer membrane lipoprotein LpoB
MSGIYCKQTLAFHVSYLTSKSIGAALRKPAVQVALGTLSINVEIFELSMQLLAAVYIY